jgi:hypothetical protein
VPIDVHYGNEEPVTEKAGDHHDHRYLGVMRGLLLGAGAVALVAALLRWGSWIAVATVGSGGSRVPSTFEVSVMEHLQLTGVLLAILAVLCAVVGRRESSVLAAVALILGSAWLVRWQLDPPAGTLTEPPFDWPLWLCAAALAMAAIAAAAHAIASDAAADINRPPHRRGPQLRVAGPRQRRT